MKTFRGIIIQEALRIKKKTQKEPSKEISISYFDGCKIVYTKHTKEIRDGELVPRNEGLRDAVILKAVKKAWKKGLKPGKTMITYKNKNKKYNMIVIDWNIKEKKIILVTSIQDNKDLPKFYRTKVHMGEPFIMTESYNDFIILEDDF